MKLLFLCGVDQAGKSTTIRRSTKFLNIDKKTIQKFLNNLHNTPKTLRIDNKVVCIFLDSPQEATSSPEEAARYLREKIDFARGKNAELLITALNIGENHNQKIDACLNEIDSMGFKVNSTFVYLDSNKQEDVFARSKMKSIQTKGFNIAGMIKRSTPDQQGVLFAKHVMNLL